VRYEFQRDQWLTDFGMIFEGLLLPQRTAVVNAALFGKPLARKHVALQGRADALTAFWKRRPGPAGAPTTATTIQNALSLNRKETP
jgi:hypothetical protein